MTPTHALSAAEVERNLRRPHTAGDLLAGGNAPGELHEAAPHSRIVDPGISLQQLDGAVLAKELEGPVRLHQPVLFGPEEGRHRDAEHLRNALKPPRAHTRSPSVFSDS